MGGAGFSAEDVRRLHRHGVSVEEAERQLAALSGGPCTVELARPCTAGDGIERLDPDEVPALHALHAEAAAAGRFLKFVPASGAATRMFRALAVQRRVASSWESLAARARAGDAEAAECVACVDEVRRFAFADELARRLAASGRQLETLVAARDLEPLFEAILDLATRPKALLPFHRYADGPRTAFEEHLVEAGLYAASGTGRSRLHFTVSRGHERAFDETARAFAERGGADAHFEIGYSVQLASTDTLALDDRGLPLRDAAGRLVLRPGGHGALIHNLAALGADLVFLKNIDNVQPDRTKPLVSWWKRALAGYLLRLEREAHRLLEALEAPEPPRALVERTAAFARERLGRDTPVECRALVAALDRPLRVCGVVPNTGEPGGGPFWVRGPHGRTTRQIVETSQVDARDAAQGEALRAATHFNPVDLVCAISDRRGRPFDLLRSIDPEAAIVTRKAEAGHEIRVLEHPGLWNGGMAHWNTVFVEVPLETFTPVKTLGDLLREEHRT